MKITPHYTGDAQFSVGQGGLVTRDDLNSAWIEENGHTPGPDAWERYVVHPDSSPDPSTWRTELNRPLVQRDSARSAEA